MMTNLETYSTMQFLTVLAAAAMAATASADVQLFTDTQCMASRYLYSTKAGQCYNINQVGNTYESAKGCSNTHNLRVYTDINCGGTYQEKAPQKCANLGGTQIKSIMCVG